MDNYKVPAVNFIGTVMANVDNEKLSDSDFREFIRNTLSIVEKPTFCQLVNEEMKKKVKKFYPVDVIGSKPTAIEKNNLPEDVRYAFNEGADLYQCIQNYEMGNLTKEVFIDDMRKIKARYQ